PNVTATLIGVSSALRVAVKLTDPTNALASGLKSISDAKKKEQELRQAFIAICLRRADETHKEHARTDAILSGEFYLNEHKTSPPKLLLAESLEPGTKPEVKGDE
ncbi:MAG TPA: hypothetical protein VJ521_14660, partial [Acidobacteriota bacterium]|nr:hypothetical protein [Acidobacteriota bacterium]